MRYRLKDISDVSKLNLNKTIMEKQNVYPITIEDNGNPSVTHLGLTKREYFAGLIIQGLCACPDLAFSRKALAEEAVKQADDLLAELNKSE
jgi:hypothetical protein